MDYPVKENHQNAKGDIYRKTEVGYFTDCNPGADQANNQAGHRQGKFAVQIHPIGCGVVAFVFYIQDVGQQLFVTHLFRFFGNPPKVFRQKVDFFDFLLVKLNIVGSGFIIQHLLHDLLEYPPILLELSPGGINATLEFKLGIEEIQCDAGYGFFLGIKIWNKCDGAVAFEPDILLAFGLGVFFDFNPVNVAGLADGHRHDDFWKQKQQNRDQNSDCENRPDKIINAQPSAFQGDDLIVFMHQTKGYKNWKQDADRRNLGDDQGQFILQKLDHAHDRQARIQKFVDIFEKIDNQIDPRGRDENNSEKFYDFSNKISIEDGHYIEIGMRNAEVGIIWF